MQIKIVISTTPQTPLDILQQRPPSLSISITTPDENQVATTPPVRRLQQQQTRRRQQQQRQIVNRNTDQQTPFSPLINLSPLPTLADFRPQPIATPSILVMPSTPENTVRRIDQRRGRPLRSNKKN
jgi:hypothetical protein